jgi:hypothetical protein
LTNVVFFFGDGENRGVGQRSSPGFTLDPDNP